jgi:serine/threonine protein kinase
MPTYEEIMIEYKSPIGAHLTGGGTITKLIADMRETEGTLVCLVKKAGTFHVAKLNNEPSDFARTVETMKTLTEIPGFHMVDWYIDTLQTSSVESDDGIIVMEHLQPVQKKQVFAMLDSIITQIFAYRSYMAHCDIKPDNIMYSPKTKQFHLIDFDTVCNKSLIYGYERIAFTPRFTSQTNNVGFVVTTIKQDLLELLWSAHAIYYEIDDVRPVASYPRWCGHRLSIFDVACMVVWNIDERHIVDDDVKLLLYVLDFIERDAKDGFLGKIRTESHQICDNVGPMTNSEICKVVGIN